VATLVVDTNILVFATPGSKDFIPEAAELLWSILNICHSIAVDEEYKIVEREYKKRMHNNPTLIAWWTHMRNKNKIQFRSGQGIQVDGLKEMDNCFACVAIRTPDRILITENVRHFNQEVKRKLASKGVRILRLDDAYNIICRDPRNRNLQ
jgi:rRNA-processing protein FCF1